MDYTLATYKSPQYEALAFGILRDRLVEIGYPPELKNFQYEPSFPVRGLWFDTLYGTMLKLDQFGNILICLRGFNTLSPDEVSKVYPHKFVKYDDDRFRIMSTLFDLPELYLLSCLVHLLQMHPSYKKVDHGVKYNHLYMSYKSICQDVERVVFWMHMGELKKQTVAKLDYYVEQNPELPIMLDKLRSGGRKVFLLTNSDFRYTQVIMTYVLEIPNHDGVIRPWVSYFDYIVTDAHKPLFFAEGTILRAVDQTTGQCSIGLHTGPLENGRVYAGGSCDVFSQLIGARSKEVLYTGDHIFGDILKSKKQVNWKTFLVIPELLSELYVWKKKKDLFNKLNHLENKLADSYMHLTITSNERPDVSQIQKNIRMVAQEMDAAYGLLGSLFRHGSRLTYFSTQAMRYADLYSHSCFNLIYYPLCYMFRSPVMFMPHESTVSHEESPIESYADLEAIPCGLRRRTMTNSEIMDDVRAMRCPLIKSRARHLSLLGPTSSLPYRPSGDLPASPDVCAISESGSEVDDDESEDKEDTDVFLPITPNPRL
ncbi:hypothetical protein AAHC03_0983 [Spirometra sp. Aus1]